MLTISLLSLLVGYMLVMISSNVIYRASYGQESDTIPPIITVPQDITEEATGPDGAQVAFEVSAEDIVDGPVDVSCNYSSQDTFPIGDRTVQCSATDQAENEGTASFTITIISSMPQPDRTPPEIAEPSDIMEQAAGPDGTQVTYAIAVQDNVDGAAILEEDGSTVTQGDGGGDIAISCEPASGSIFPIADRLVECSATDVAQNVGTASFRVTVASPSVPPTDLIRPVITLPPDIIKQAAGPDGAQVAFEVSALDDVDGLVDVTCDRNSGDTFPISETVVTCTAEDSASNRAQEFFIITVRESQPYDDIMRWVREILFSPNGIGLIVLIPIGILGIVLVKHNYDRKRIRSRTKKIPSSSIVEIRAKGGIRE